MTYSAGNIIVATDYNGFVSTTANANINSTWATATSGAGYGQTAIAQVSVGGTVTATQWSDLVTTLSAMGSHTGTTITSRTAPVAGNIISVLANVNTDITNCFTNRNNAASSGTTSNTWTGNSAKTSATGSGGAAWTITFTHTVTWANNAACFAFFNSGGIIKWETSKTADSTEADTEWNALATTVVGDIYLTGAAESKTINSVAYTGTTKIGGSGTPTTLATGTGFFNLTTTATTIYKQFSSLAPYTGQFIQINASVNSNTAPTVLTFSTTWVDPGSASPGGDNISGGTDTASPFTAFGTAPATVVRFINPETTNLTAVWGTPAVAASVV
jgi:hypothetical protein